MSLEFIAGAIVVFLVLLWACEQYGILAAVVVLGLLALVLGCVQLPPELFSHLAAQLLRG